MNLSIREIAFFIILVYGWSLPSSAETYLSPFGLDFLRIPAGEFIMGTQDFDLLAEEVKPERLPNLRKELPAHKVRISRDFWLASTEVTQRIWYEVMGYKPGKEERWQRQDWENLPVSRVSWESVHEFIDTINRLDDTFQYRLPTEAEWEYAARAGTTGLRPFDYEQMSENAWFRENSGDKPMPVGSLKANAWGLFDMVGNVWEWVEDSYDANYYSVSPFVDPPGPEVRERKVMRGGSYHCTAERVRVAIRGSYVKARSLSILGFRLAANKK